MADQIRVNGNMVGWGSITIRLDDEVFSGFDSISYGDKRERVKHYGMGRAHAPRGRTSGKYTVENTKLRGPKGTVMALRTALARRAADGKSYGNVEFPIVVQYVESGEVPITVELERNAIVSDVSSDDESGDPSKEEIECDTMLIRRNGLTLFDNTGAVAL